MADCNRSGGRRQPSTRLDSAPSRAPCTMTFPSTIFRALKGKVQSIQYQDDTCPGLSALAWDILSRLGQQMEDNHDKMGICQSLFFRISIIIAPQDLLKIYDSASVKDPMFLHTWWSNKKRWEGIPSVLRESIKTNWGPNTLPGLLIWAARKAH